MAVGAGFIGSNFIDYLLKIQICKYFNLDLLTYAGDLNKTKILSLIKDPQFIHGDICDHKLVGEYYDFNIDGIINFAAESHVDNSIKSPGIL